MTKLLLHSALFFATALFVSAQVKTPIPTPKKVPFTESLQAIIVTTPDWPATQGKARLFERKDQRSKWTPVADAFPIVVGRSGLAWSRDTAPEKATEFKAEGDGKAPAGMFPLTFAFGPGVKPEAVTIPYIRLEQNTECVDDSNSSHYNTIIDRMKVGNLDWNSSEKMLAVGAEYELGVFVAHNSYPVRKGDGSCIFLHIWKDAASPTTGCTAMERTKLERILTWLDPKSNPYLVQLPEKEYKSLTKAWGLPKL
jgi:L,D-peptidoglycan transpeptidase YkuD (ErfK/YbiS/YcfS/YnhG family)